MTLDVFSINNKKQVLERYLKTNRVKIAVITETHLQEGDHAETHIKGYKLASSCSRKKGQQKGGAAIFAHNSIPCVEGEHREAREKMG